MAPNPFLLGGFNAATGMLSGLLGTHFDTKKQKELLKYQNDLNMQNWMVQNEYNSPINSMQRLKDAGLNPNLVYGSGIQGNVADSIQKATPTSEDSYRRTLQDSVNSGFGTMFNAFQKDQSQQQIDNQKPVQDATAQNLKEEAHNKKLAAPGIEAEAKSKIIKADIDEKDKADALKRLKALTNQKESEQWIAADQEQMTRRAALRDMIYTNRYSEILDTEIKQQVQNLRLSREEQKNLIEARNNMIEERKKIRKEREKLFQEIKDLDHKVRSTGDVKIAKQLQDRQAALQSKLTQLETDYFNWAYTYNGDPWHDMLVDTNLKAYYYGRLANNIVQPTIQGFNPINVMVPGTKPFTSNQW